MIVLLFGFLFLVFAALLFFVQIQANKLVHPKRQVASSTPAKVGIAYWEDVSFNTKDGLQLRAWFVPPSLGANGATVVCAHGTGANRGYFLHHAAVLHQAGYGVLLFDFRHHGASDGRVSSLGIFEIHDLHASFAYLQSRSDVNPDRIALIGHSMGGATILRAAARDLKVQALVVISAVSSLSENLANGVRYVTKLPAFPLAPLIVKICEWHTHGKISDMKPIKDLEQLGNTPLLLVYGDQDKFVPLENGQRLRSARRHDTTLVVVRGAGHRSILSKKFLPSYETKLMAFLARHLPIETPEAQAQFEQSLNPSLASLLVAIQHSKTPGNAAQSP
jgi:uncharacterized protein